MARYEKFIESADQRAGGVVPLRGPQSVPRLVLSPPAKQALSSSTGVDRSATPISNTPGSDPTSSAGRPGSSVSAGSDPMEVVETGVTVLVMAPALTVCHYLTDIANIARGLPGVRSVYAGEKQTLTIRYGDAARRITRLASGRFRIDQQRQQVEWEIRASVLYSGTISIYGDSNISQLHSTLRSDQRSPACAARDIHLQILHRIARAAEQALDLFRAPLAAGDPPPPRPAARQPGVAPVSPLPGQLAVGGAEVLGGHGIVRECWAGDVPGLSS